MLGFGIARRSTFCIHAVVEVGIHASGGHMQNLSIPYEVSVQIKK
jgi:hypothetical protein